MWIHKNSKELLESLESPFFLKFTASNPMLYITTLYTTISHDKLKTRLFSIIDSCFFNKNGKRKYSYLVVQLTYVVIHDSDSTHKCSAVDIKEMLRFFTDTIFVVFRYKIFQRTDGIPMGTNCAPLLADLFLHGRKV
jgi:hypothetical protein